MTKIILMRHGEAEGNKNQILMWCREGSYLTENWKKQVEQVWLFLQKNLEIDHIFASPVQRAKETALIVNNYINTKISYDTELREIDWWDISGLHISQIPQEISRGFHKNPFSYIHPNWESIEIMFQRVNNILRKIPKNTDKTYLIITHDNVIKWLIASMKQLWKEALGFKISNASLTYYDEVWEKYICEKFNQIVYKLPQK